MTDSRARTLGICLLLVAAASACTNSTGQLHAGGQPGRPASAAREAKSGAPDKAVAAEQSKAGTSSWMVRSWAKPDVLGGYTSTSSVKPGEPISLHVRSIHRTVHVAAYRTGFYGGTGATQVWQRDVLVLPPGPPTLLQAATRTWTANWPESTSVSTKNWAPGHYLFLLSAGGQQTWVPFTLRSPSFAGKVVIITENTTWQAYNAYGGASLYHGSNGARKTRAYIVSHDRPIDYGSGAGDFKGNEMPLIRLADELKLPLAFATDTDLEAAPGLLDGARAIISLGHDEYWSSRMRAQLLQARDKTGTNLAFLGANAIYRHIRLEALNGRANRLEVGYKSASLDPISTSNPAEATADWPSGPVPRDGKELTGAAYQCNPVHGDLVLTDTSTWLTHGLHLAPGFRLVNVLGSEYDKIVPGAPAPTSLMSIARSPLTCVGRADHADFAYYTVQSGAAGVDVGTSTWVCVLQNACGALHISPQVRDVVTAITTTILTEFARGPAGARHPVG